LSVASPFLICGCSLLVKETQVTVTRTNIIGLDTAGADIECSLAVSNPNFVSFPH